MTNLNLRRPNSDALEEVHGLVCAGYGAEHGERPPDGVRSGKELFDAFLLMGKVADHSGLHQLGVAGEQVVVLVAEVALDAVLLDGDGVVAADEVEHAGDQSVGAELIEPMDGAVEAVVQPAEACEVAAWTAVHLHHEDLLACAAEECCGRQTADARPDDDDIVFRLWCCTQCRRGLRGKLNYENGK
jgi:hypothetical protein